MWQIMGQTGGLLGTGEYDIESKQDELWDKTWWLLGQEKSILHLNKVKYGTEQGHFLGQEKLTYGHNEMNFGTEQGDFLGQEKSILGLFEMNYRT